MVDIKNGHQDLLYTELSFANWVERLSCAEDAHNKEQLAQAWQQAQQAYAQQLRNPGIAYQRHGAAVAAVLDELELSVDVVCAGLLHGLSRLDNLDEQQLAERLGATVAHLVAGASQVDAIVGLQEPANPGDRQVEAVRKMILAMARDIRVVCIALAVRLIDMRQLDDWPPAERRYIARQTLELYAPLANRLGIFQLKWELEDLSLRALRPEHYRRIAQQLSARRIERLEEIDEFQDQLTRALQQAGIPAQVTGRPKHIFSIWKKMRQKDLPFQEVFDIRAFRVLVDTVEQCYAALAIVHELWSPLTREYSDYIVVPKANNYQSLHTVVQGPANKALEVQFRTHDMHDHAEHGVAAHWRYKEGGQQDDSLNERIAWLRELLQWARTEAGQSGLLHDYQHEVLEERIYVLTPQGDVVDLPNGATPVEFAYQIHTQVGHHCCGAKVNGKMVPLKRKLATGDQVSILTAHNARPSWDWLDPAQEYLVSNRNRAKVQRWFRARDYDRHVVEGRSHLERELRRLGEHRSVNFEKLAQQARFAQLNDFLAAIGRGEITGSQIAGLLDRQWPRKPSAPSTPHGRGPESSSSDGGALIIGGADNLYTRMAQCCQPSYSDAVIGFITRNYGISIHRQDCVNIARLDTVARERLIKAEWGSKNSS